MADEETPQVYVFGGDSGPPRRRGRPKAAVPSTALTTWIPATYYDKLNQMANGRHMTISSLVRQILVLKIEKFEK